MGSAQNLTLVAMPPLSLAVLGSGSSLHSRRPRRDRHRRSSGSCCFVAVPIRLRPRLEHEHAEDSRDPGRSAGQNPRAPASRWFGFAFRREWIPLLVITLLYVSHWGVVTAYLPQRAELAGADVGLFFVADGIAILALRIPSGWLADRIQPRWLVLTGLLLTAIAIGLLVLPPSTPVLVLAGALTGGGARACPDAPPRRDLAAKHRRRPWQRLRDVLGRSSGRRARARQHRSRADHRVGGFEATILATIAGLACASGRRRWPITRLAAGSCTVPGALGVT